MSDREILLLLEDMRDAALKIISYTSGMSFDDFTNDDKTIDAVVRNFEIIGEAANRVPEDFKSDHPEIEWRRMTGLRNRIIHEYFGINYVTVWKIKEENIPELADFIQQAIDNLAGNTEFGNDYK
jgi:uncharacterized protein with HEPN domain